MNPGSQLPPLKFVLVSISVGVLASQARLREAPTESHSCLEQRGDVGRR